MTLPKENLDNKAFSDLLKEAISRIPVYAPEWTDHNLHDPGITFIELFAGLTEMQIYRLNRITDKNYRKFLKLMGIPKLKPATAAKVDVTFYLKPGISQADVPAGTVVAATDSVTGEDILFETMQDLKTINTELTILSYTAKSNDTNNIINEPYINNTEANRNDNVYYYAFGMDEPKKGDELYIGFKKNPGTDIYLAFYLQDDESFKEVDNSVLVPYGTLIWEYYADGKWNPIEEITDGTRHLTVSGKVKFKIKQEMEKTDIKIKDVESKDIESKYTEIPYWLRCTVESEGYQIPSKIDCILLNTVLAIHAVQRETKFSSTGLPGFCINIEYTPVLDTTLVVNINEKPWTKVEDFDASKPGDMHYIVDLSSGKVTFGDGINGKIPPKGTDNITVSYSSGGGTIGNVKPGAIARIIENLVPSVVTRVLDRPLAESVTVRNEREASGGAESETIEEAIQRTRKELKDSHKGCYIFRL